MARQEPEAYFLSIRDAVESQRLNQQHINVKAMHNGRLLHQSVPQLRAETRVAEVATGTGAWLHDAIHSNNLEPQSTAEQAQYVGFDISPAQFPAQKIPGVDFAVHDASQPFPEKYHGIFDLVHIRYLVLAIREEQYAQILQNVTQLLRPGGYLHWQETGPHEDMLMEPPHHALGEEVIERLDAIRVERGMSLSPMRSLLGALCRMPCLPARKGSLSGFRAPQLDIVAVNRTNPRTLPAEVKAETKRLSGVSVPFLIRSAATGKRQQAEAAGPYDIEKQRNLTGEADLYEDLGQQLQEATNAGDVSFVNSVVTLVAQKASEE